MSLLGLKEVKTNLRGVMGAHDNALRTAALAGARIVRDAMRAGVTKKTRHGERSIIARRRRGVKGLGVAIAGPTRDAFYLHFIEYGARAHEIKVASAHKVIDPRSRKIIGKQPARKALKLGVGGSLVFRKSVPHPGIIACPALGPAYRQVAQSAVTAMGAAYIESITKGLQKRGVA